MSSKIIIFKITDLLPVYRLSMKEWKGHCESNRQKYYPIPTLLQGCHIQNPDIQLTPRQFSRCDTSKRALFYDVKERFSSVEQQLVLYQLRYMLRKKKKKGKLAPLFIRHSEVIPKPILFRSHMFFPRFGSAASSHFEF